MSDRIETLDRAKRIVGACERALRRKLSPGEMRDLLADNTDWTGIEIQMAVQAILKG